MRTPKFERIYLPPEEPKERLDYDQILARAVDLKQKVGGLSYLLIGRGESLLRVTGKVEPNDKCTILISPFGKAQIFYESHWSLNLAWAILETLLQRKITFLYEPEYVRGAKCENDVAWYAKGIMHACLMTLASKNIQKEVVVSKGYRTTTSGLKGLRVLTPVLNVCENSVS